MTGGGTQAVIPNHLDQDQDLLELCLGNPDLQVHTIHSHLDTLMLLSPRQSNVQTTIRAEAVQVAEAATQVGTLLSLIRMRHPGYKHLIKVNKWFAVNSQISIMLCQAPDHK